MLALGTQVPEFSLVNAVDGRHVSPKDYRSERALLVMIICNHCPYVKHVLREIGRIAAKYQSKGVGLIAISSNDVAAFPDDGPERMRGLAATEGWKFPYLFDESQEVAKAFQAACTPEFYVFDGARRLVYRGQLDDSRPNNTEPVRGKDLRAALDAVLAGKPVSQDQKPSIGCNVKWKPGNEPTWFTVPAA
ncbi:MAG: alkyl hydroperoxide reductase [Gemmatimonadetes bacterium RBG_16_66_8]|nr:MAG: alkyl hydroperoxide reductase [Gemmatimonadetes bacterium RBG_16_66_8]